MFNVPAELHETTIPHRPRVVFVPTVHVLETRPPDVRFEPSPCARDGPDLEFTVIEQVAFGLIDAVSVA